MRSKKFRIVRLKQKAKFKKSLQSFNLTPETSEILNTVSTNNILSTIFNSLLREKGMDYHKYSTSADLIKLYSALAILDFFDANKNKKIIGEIKKVIAKLNKQNGSKKVDFKSENLEQKMLKGIKLTTLEKESYFNEDKYYENIAKVFALPFDDQKYYDLAYLLAMYVSVESFFNKYNIPEDINIFLVKIQIQQEVLLMLRDVLPKSFNTLVISMNKWFNKFDKKFVKALSARKAGE